MNVSLNRLFLIALPAMLYAVPLFPAFASDYASTQIDRGMLQVVDLKEKLKSGPLMLGPKKENLKAPKNLRKSFKEETKAKRPKISPYNEQNSPVAIELLKELGTDSVGIIDDASGGLGSEMWKGVSRRLVTKLLTRLPTKVRSPTMRGLLRRLLLTQAITPEGNEKKPDLLKLRVATLFSGGDVTSALALIAGAPVSPDDEFILHTSVESRLHLNDTSGACNLIRNVGEKFKKDYWQQAIAFCLAMDEKIDQAILFSEVLAERSENIHPSFFAAMESLSGATPPPITSLKNPSALQLALMRAAGLNLPIDVTTNASLPALRTIAVSPNASISLRLSAAETAAELGLINAKTLNEIYMAVSFENKIYDLEVLQNSIKNDEILWDAKGRARLIQAANNFEVPAAKAEVIKTALEFAKTKGNWLVTAIGNAPIISSIVPSADLTWFSGYAARALFTAGKPGVARKWLNIVIKNDQIEEEKSALWALLTLDSHQTSSPIDLKGFNQWWNLKTSTRIKSFNHLQSLFSLLYALEVSIPSDLWPIVMKNINPRTGVMPNVITRNLLESLAQAGSKGSTVAMAIIVLGEQGPVLANFSAVELVVKALNTVGLKKEARLVALEAAVAAGL